MAFVKGQQAACSAACAPRQACVTGMFELRDFSAFKQHARDFLVQTKSFADKDNAELFAEEAAAMREVRSLIHSAMHVMVRLSKPCSLSRLMGPCMQ